MSSKNFYRDCFARHRCTRFTAKSRLRHSGQQYSSFQGTAQSLRRLNGPPHLGRVQVRLGILRGDLDICGPSWPLKLLRCRLDRSPVLLYPSLSAGVSTRPNLYATVVVPDGSRCSKSVLTRPIRTTALRTGIRLVWYLISHVNAI